MKRLWLHIVLFLLTVLSTLSVNGPLYSAAIMCILLAHEMGHYLVSRRYGVPATLPFFIPLPVPPFGTLGAVIRMKGAIHDKRALFDIGVAGPLCGFVLAVPCIFVGLKLSAVVKVSHGADMLFLNEPLLLKMAERLVLGELPPGHDVLIHPIAYAGWVGLFITALNLLPVGQLDGGHIVYGVFGKRSVLVSRALIPALVLLAVFYNVGWLLLVGLLLYFGVGHPQPLDADTPLDPKRRILAFIMLLVFVVSFIPAPFPDSGLIDILRPMFVK